MARTQSADYDKKRETIMDNAARLFAIHGFAGASISQIAFACKTSKALIYHYYPSKEAILFDVMNDYMDSLLAVAHEVVANEPISPEDKFRRLTRAILHSYAGAADQQKVLLYELDALPNDKRAEVVSKEREVIDLVKQTLLECKPTFNDQPAFMQATTMLYFGMLNWTHTWYKGSGPISRDDLADMAANKTLASL